MCGTDIFLGILALLFPPLPVWVKRGICSADSFINIALCCLGVLPGLIHAWYIISLYPEPTYEQIQQNDAEGGPVTYYYVERGGQPSQGGGQAQRGYGTVGAPSNSASAPAQQFPGQQNGTMPGAQQYKQQRPMQGGGSSSGPSTEVPPTYAEAVKGDNKVQSRE